MSALKHIVDWLVMPLSFALLLCVAAAVCYVRGRRRSGKSLLLAAAVVAYLASLDPVGDLLLQPLESRYRPLSQAALPGPVGYIVVLGAGYAPGNEIPVSAALNEDGLKRLVEAVVLMRRLGIGKMLVSGGAAPGHVPPALGYAELARQLGVSNGSIVISDRSLDTAAEAHAIVKLLGNRLFVLVTSAYHMPRAVRLMTSAGAHPIPAPCGQRIHPDRHLNWRSLVPTSDGIANTDRALHEYVGLAALSMGLE